MKIPNIALPKIISLINRKKLPIIYAVIGLGIGFAGWQTLKIITVTPSQTYIDQQKSALEKSQIKFDPKTVAEVKNFLQVPVNVTTGDPGKADPFN